ncbi:hypothetical protein MLD52_05605 [Puniceicoccaceae bacterium K14]|nr:hypothetical protein [Puniceicoccaceae bacterium K14]
MRKLLLGNRYTGTAIALSICLSSIDTLRSEIEVIALKGEQIGTNAYTYESFSTPSLNRYGELAFAANFEEFETGVGSKYEGICLYNYQGTTLIAASGQIAPKPGDDGLFDYFYKPTLNELGISYFRGKMQGSGWAVNTNGTWIGWTINQDGTATPQLDMLARFWDQASINYENESAENDGRYTQIGHPQIIEPKSFGFIGMLDGESYEGVTGAWHQPAKNSDTWYIPRPELIAISGLPMPGHSEIVSRVVYYKPINEDEALVLVELDGNSTNSTVSAIYRTKKGEDAELIARTGDTALGEAAPFASFGIPQFDKNGNILFWASLIDEDQNEGLYAYANTTIEPLVSTSGEFTLDQESYNLNTIFDPKINANGDIAFLGHLESPNNDEYAIFHKAVSSANWTCLTKSGQQAISANLGAVFDQFSSPILNETGDVAFSATLKGEGDAVSDTSDSGIWVTDENGSLNMLLREGDTLRIGSNKLRTVSGFTIGGFNSEHEIALWVSFTNYSSAIAIGKVDNVSPPNIVTPITDENLYAGDSLELSAEVEGTGPFLYQWIKDGTDLMGENSKTLTITNFSTFEEGNYSLRIESPAGAHSRSIANLVLTDAPSIPVFVEEPLGDIALLGANSLLTSRAVSNLEISYQWFKNDTAIDGEILSDLLFDEIAIEDEGIYYVIATTTAGAVTSESVEILVTDKRMVNLSTRARAGTGANVVISGFVIKGNEPKTVLIRGIGPSLKNFGLDEALEQPQLTVIQDGEVIASNNGWANLANQAEVAAIAAQYGAFELDTDSADAAVLITLEPGVYTAILNGENGETGLSMVEVYEVGKNSTRLANLSTRAHVGVGANIAIPGVVISGDLPSKLLVRAVGPSLEDFDLPGVLEDPILHIINSSGEIIATNERWMDVDDLESLVLASSTAGAFPLNDNSNDAAILIDLEPGIYTIFVVGRDGSSGLALIELYDIPASNF